MAGSYGRKLCGSECKRSRASDRKNSGGEKDIDGRTEFHVLSSML